MSDQKAPQGGSNAGSDRHTEAASKTTIELPAFAGDLKECVGEIENARADRRWSRRRPPPLH
jgi:hypothetical protein